MRGVWWCVLLKALVAARVRVKKKLPRPHTSNEKQTKRQIARKTRETQHILAALLTL